jgi:hypothetical protein
MPGFVETVARPVPPLSAYATKMDVSLVLAKWDTKRRTFLKAIAPMLDNIAPPTVVSAEDFKMKTDLLAEAQAELDASEEEIRWLKERLAATEALKDKVEVAALRAEYTDSGVSEQFNTLTDEVKEFRAILKSGEVMKFALSDHYGKPYRVNWFQDRDEFEAAARLGFMEFEDGDRVVWSKRQMKELKQKLDELDSFIAEHEKALQASEGNGVPLEPGDQDFWEFHYKV